MKEMKDGNIYLVDDELHPCSRESLVPPMAHRPPIELECLEIEQHFVVAGQPCRATS